MRRRERAALWILGAGLFVASAYAVGTSDRVVTRLVRSYAASHILGPATVEGASFSFLGGVVVRGVEVGDPADPLGPPVLRVERVLVDYQLDVLGRGPRVTALELVRPELRVHRRGDGRIGLAEVFAYEPDEDRSAPPPRSVLRDGRLVFSDVTLLGEEPLVLSGVEGTLEPAEGGGAVAELVAATDLVGPLRAEARIAPAGGPAEITVHLDAVALNPGLASRFRGTAADVLARLTPTGSLSAELTVTLPPDAPAEVRGEAALSGVSLRVELPEDADAPEGSDPPRPLEVVGVTGRVRLAGGRLSTEGLEGSLLGARVVASGAVALPASGRPAELDLTLRVEGLRVDERVGAVLPHALRRVRDAYELDVSADATVRVVGAAEAPDVGAEIEALGGSLRYVGYPQEDGRRVGFAYRVDDVRGHLSLERGRLLRVRAEGRHGPARISAEGSIDHPPGDSIPDLRVVAEEVPLDGELRAAFQHEDRQRPLFDRWGPSGTARRIVVRIDRDPAVDPPEHSNVDVVLELDGRAAFRPELLPADLREARGRVEVTQPVVDDRRPSVVRLVDLRFRGDGFELALDGSVTEDGPLREEDLDVRGATQDASGALGRAVLASEDPMLETVREVLGKLRPAGALRFHAAVRGGPAGRADEVAVTLEGASVAGFGDVPLAAEELRGDVRLTGSSVLAEALTGRVLDAPFEATGRVDRLDADPTIDLDFRAVGLPLGESLRTALGPLAAEASRFWDELRPVGGAGTLGTRATVRLRLRPEESREPPIELWLDDVRGPLRPLGLELDTLGGRLHYDGARVTVEALEAAIGAADLRIEHALYDVPSGRLEVAGWARGLHFPEHLEGPLSAEDVAAIAEAAPGRVVHAEDVRLVYDAAARTLDVGAGLAIRPRSRRALPDPGLAPEGRLDVERLTLRLPADGSVEFDGVAEATGLALQAGVPVTALEGRLLLEGRAADTGSRVRASTEGASFEAFGLPFRDVSLLVDQGPRGVRVDVAADVHGGRFAARVGPGSERVAFSGEVHLLDADVGRLVGGVAAPEVSGLLDLHARFRNPTGVPEDLSGEGTVDVRDGRLGRVPVLAALSDLLTLWLTEPPQFRRGSARFRIDGRLLEVEDLEVESTNLVLEGGRGTVSLDGRLDVVVHARMRVSTGLPPVDLVLNVPLLGFRELLRFHVGGTVRSPVTRWLRGGEAELGRREPQPSGEPITPPERPW